MTKNLRQAAIDEKMDNYITGMIENFILYSNKEEYLGKFSFAWIWQKALGLLEMGFPY